MGIPYEVHNLILTANVPRTLRVATRFVALISATVDATAVSVSIGDSDSFQPLIIGVVPTDLLGVTRLVILSTSSQTVRIATGSAMINDTRAATGGGTLALSLVDIGGNGLGPEAKASSVSVTPATDQVSWPTAGTAAHSAASVGNPVRVGGRVATAADTTLADGDAADLRVTSGGDLVAKPYSIPETDWTYAAAGIVNTNVAVTIKAAAAAGLKNYLTGLDFTWEALTNATEVVIRDGAAGTVLHRWHIGAGAAGEKSITFPTPLRGTAATLLEVCTLTASGAGALWVNAQGYAAP